MTFAMLLKLVTASNAENAETLWGFIGRYRPGVTQADASAARRLVDYAIHYYQDFVLPAKQFREPSAPERAALVDLRDALSQLPADATAETIQNVVYEVGRREPFLDQKKKAKDGKPGVALDWFNMLYQVLLGQEKGPRFGSFVAAYGLQNTDGHDRRRAGAERVIFHLPPRTAGEGTIVRSTMVEGATATQLAPRARNHSEPPRAPSTTLLRSAVPLPRFADAARGRMRSLTRPQNPCDPQHVARRQRAVRVRGVERA